MSAHALKDALARLAGEGRSYAVIGLSNASPRALREARRDLRRIETLLDDAGETLRAEFRRLESLEDCAPCEGL